MDIMDNLKLICIQSDTIPKKLTSLSFQSKQYLTDGLHIYEMIKYEENLRSFFCGDYVISEGKLVMITKVDPLYILLPILHDNQSKYQDILNICSSYDFLKGPILSDDVDISVLGDIKIIDGEKYIRYNQDKVLKWLAFKVKLIAQELENLKVDVCSDLTKVRGFDSGRRPQIDKRHYIKYAIEMIALYVHEELVTALVKKLGISDLPVQTEENFENKKRILDESSTNDFFQPASSSDEINKKQKITKSQKELSKAAKDMKKITSFFKTK